MTGDTNHFDRACKFLLKEEGLELLAWLTRKPAADLRLVTWLDTTFSIPGHPTRTSDVIAHVLRLDRGGEPWAVDTEFQTEPDSEMPGRGMIYQGLAWLQLRPTGLVGDRFKMLFVVNLTGEGNARREMDWDEETGDLLRPREINLRAFAAEVILREIGQGTAPRGLMPWVPLMHGGNDSGIMQEWRNIADAETDVRRRTRLKLVLVFAGLAQTKEPWEKALEGYDVKESEVVNEWIAAGVARAAPAIRAEGEARLLGRMIRSRFGQLPDDLASKLAQANEANLEAWGDLFGVSNTLDDFRARTGL